MERTLRLRILMSFETQFRGLQDDSLCNIQTIEVVKTELSELCLDGRTTQC